MKQQSAIVASVVFCLSIAATAASAADRVRTVNEGGIRDQWMLADGAKLAAPGYPGPYAARGDDLCMAMGYMIKPDGSTSDFTLLKAWTSSTGEKEPVQGYWETFAQAGADALSQWKFKPRPEVTSPLSTQTVATLHFMGKGQQDVAAVRAHCKIGDLVAFMQESNDERNKKGGINRNQLDRVYQSRTGQLIRQKTAGTALSGP